MTSETRPRPRVPPADFTPTIPTLMRRAVQCFGDDLFVITNDRDMTFIEMDEESRAIALRLLTSGVGKGTRVAFLLPQGPDWIATFLAITRIGAIGMPLSTFYTPAEMQSSLKLGDASHLVVPETLDGTSMDAFCEQAITGLADVSGEELYLPSLPFLRKVLVQGTVDRPWARSVFRNESPAYDETALLDAIQSEVVPSDHMVTMFTSGTTSGPKGVTHTHGAQIRHVVNIADVRSMKRGDRFFAVSPFFWVAGLTFQVLPALYIGGALVCQERFEPATALDLIERNKPNIYMGWPNALMRMRQDPSYPKRDLVGVQWLSADRADEEPGQRHSGLGMTETGGNHSIAPADEADRLLPDDLRGAFGCAVPYVQHKIVDPESNLPVPPGVEGEICVRGYSVMVGYVKKEREETFDLDGWFHTGDYGYFRDGYLFFTGRANDMIKVAGSNVAPREVEDALTDLREVKLALAMGLPDAQRGEIVVLGLILQKGETINPEQVRSHLRAKLSSYKVPRDPAHVVVFDDGDIPWINDSKPDRKVARELAAQRLGRQL
jgi:acyl-CoA synthetase (AMP-forming)/AMP-acid ligase II